MKALSYFCGGVCFLNFFLLKIGRDYFYNSNDISVHSHEHLHGHRTTRKSWETGPIVLASCSAILGLPTSSFGCLCPVWIILFPNHPTCYGGSTTSWAEPSVAGGCSACLFCQRLNSFPIFLQWRKGHTKWEEAPGFTLAKMAHKVGESTWIWTRGRQHQPFLPGSNAAHPLKIPFKNLTKTF